MNRLRVLIVDDSRLARSELRTLLAAHPEVEVVGEADDVDSAVAACGGTDTFPSAIAAATTVGHVEGTAHTLSRSPARRGIHRATYRHACPIM